MYNKRCLTELKENKMEAKYIVTENHESNDCYTMLGVVASYIDWEKKQNRVVRGGQVDK